MLHSYIIKYVDLYWKIQLICCSSHTGIFRWSFLLGRISTELFMWLAVFFIAINFSVWVFLTISFPLLSYFFISIIDVFISFSCLCYCPFWVVWPYVWWCLWVLCVELHLSSFPWKSWVRDWSLSDKTICRGLSRHSGFTLGSAHLGWDYCFRLLPLLLFF